MKRILRIGLFGNDVKELQNLLGITADGWFGEKTRSAVAKFQKENGLAVDGVVGVMTYKKLSEVFPQNVVIQNLPPVWLILHCSATIERTAGFNAKSIVYYHVSILRFGRPGYGRIIEDDGKIVETWRVDTTDGIQPFEMTYGVGNFGLGAGIDFHALNICYTGGLDKNGRPKDTRTPEQIESMNTVVWDMLKKHPNLKIAGHYQFQNKACPCFSVPKYLQTIDVPEKNIYLANPYGYYK